MQKKMVFWDFGNVIGEFRMDEFLEYQSLLFSSKPKTRDGIKEISTFLDTELTDGHWRMPFWHAIETFPFWTPERVYQTFCDHFKKYPDYDYFIEAWNRPLRSDPEHKERFLEFTKRIGEASHLQGLISNTNSIHAGKMEKELSYLLRYIPSEFRFYSWKMKMRKGKDPVLFDAIFSDMGKYYNFKKSDIFFIDDKEENITGAKKAGAKTFQFSIGDGVYRLEERFLAAGLEL